MCVGVINGNMLLHPNLKLQQNKVHFQENFVALIRAVCFVKSVNTNLTTESVEGSALSLQGVDNVHCGDGLALGMLGICDCVSDNVLKENFENATSFLVYQSRNTFHTASTSQTTNSWLGDSLDVVTQNFPVSLCASLSESLSSFSTSRHDYCLLLVEQQLTNECRSMTESGLKYLKLLGRDREHHFFLLFSIG